MTIKELIQKLAGTDIDLHLILCKVKSVDESQRTCELEPVNGESNLEDSRLQASVQNDKGFVIIPAKDSFVYAAMYEPHSAVVVITDTIDKILIDIENSSLQGDKNGWVFNGGNNNGMVKIDSMVSWMKNVASDMATLQTQLSTWAVTGNGAPLGMTFTPQTTSPTNADFEDKKVKH